MGRAQAWLSEQLRLGCGAWCGWQGALAFCGFRAPIVGLQSAIVCLMESSSKQTIEAWCSADRRRSAAANVVRPVSLRRWCPCSKPQLLLQPIKRISIGSRNFALQIALVVPRSVCRSMPNLRLASNSYSPSEAESPVSHGTTQPSAGGCLCPLNSSAAPALATAASVSPSPRNAAACQACLAIFVCIQPIGSVVLLRCCR